MLKRIKRFENIVGNRGIVEKVREMLEERAFPDFVILYGNEGIGKTTLANIIAAELAELSESDQVKLIDKNKSVQGVQKYTMSTDSSIQSIKDTVSDIMSSISSTKVYILDEAQDMSNLCQNTLLTASEYLEGKHIIMCTTDLNRLNKTLQSRAYTLYMKDPTHLEVVGLVNDRISTQMLRIHNQNMFVELLVNKYKRPRACLKVVEAMGIGKTIREDQFDLYVEYEPVSVYKKLLKALNQSIHNGIMLAEEISSIDQLLMFTEACILRSRRSSTLYKAEDLQDVVDNVDENKLIKFYSNLCKDTNHSNLKRHIISSFIDANGRLTTTNTINDETLYTSRYGSRDVNVTASKSSPLSQAGAFGTDRKPASLAAIIADSIKVEN